MGPESGSVPNSLHFDYDIEEEITVYQLIFSNIILLIFFSMLGVIVYHKEKKNRYEYLDFEAMTKEKETRAQTKITNANINIYNNMLPKIDESISALSNDLPQQNNPRLSDPSNDINDTDIDDIYVNKAIAALPKPLYRLQSNIESIHHGAIEQQTSSIFSSNNTTDYHIGSGIFMNRAKNYQMLYQTAKVNDFFLFFLFFVKNGLFLLK